MLGLQPSHGPCCCTIQELQFPAGPCLAGVPGGGTSSFVSVIQVFLYHLTSNPAFPSRVYAADHSCGAYQEVAVRDGEQKLDKGLQGVVQCIIPVQAEDPEVDVAPAQCSLQHREADGNPLELQGVDLILWDLPKR